jgi:hypothetical protein
MMMLFLISRRFQLLGPPAHLKHLDPVEMGADLGGQDFFGVILFDQVLIEVGLELLGFHVEMNGGKIRRFLLFPLLNLLPGRFGNGAKPGKLDLAPVLLRQVIAEILLDLFDIYIFIFFHLGWLILHFIQFFIYYNTFSSRMPASGPNLVDYFPLFS